MVLLATNGFAQQQPAIPIDKAVRIGKLDNGLTYYIRHNAEPKGQANFYIAQRVGSILEEEDQRGLAHFLEHMCFNGTNHFPGNGVVKATETAVGTDGLLKEYDGWTNKFIFPPYDFGLADTMIANFYHPYSTLLMETAAFGGYDLVMEAYNLALKHGFMFGCYGDAMQFGCHSAGSERGSATACQCLDLRCDLLHNGYKTGVFILPGVCRVQSVNV